MTELIINLRKSKYFGDLSDPSAIPACRVLKCQLPDIPYRKDLMKIFINDDLTGVDFNCYKEMVVKALLTLDDTKYFSTVYIDEEHDQIPLGKTDGEYEAFLDLATMKADKGEPLVVNMFTHHESVDGFKLFHVSTIKAALLKSPDYKREYNQFLANCRIPVLNFNAGSMVTQDQYAFDILADEISRCVWLKYAMSSPAPVHNFVYTALKRIGSGDPSAFGGKAEAVAGNPGSAPASKDSATVNTKVDSQATGTACNANAKAWKTPSGVRGSSAEAASFWAAIDCMNRMKINNEYSGNDAPHSQQGGSGSPGMGSYSQQGGAGSAGMGSYSQQGGSDSASTGSYSQQGDSGSVSAGSYPQQGVLGVASAVPNTQKVLPPGSTGTLRSDYESFINAMNQLQAQTLYEAVGSSSSSGGSAQPSSNQTNGYAFSSPGVENGNVNGQAIGNSDANVLKGDANGANSGASGANNGANGAKGGTNGAHKGASGANSDANGANGNMGFTGTALPTAPMRFMSPETAYRFWSDSAATSGWSNAMRMSDGSVFNLTSAANGDAVAAAYGSPLEQLYAWSLSYRNAAQYATSQMNNGTANGYLYPNVGAGYGNQQKDPWLHCTDNQMYEYARSIETPGCFNNRWSQYKEFQMLLLMKIDPVPEDTQLPDWARDASPTPFVDDSNLQEALAIYNKIPEEYRDGMRMLHIYEVPLMSSVDYHEGSEGMAVFTNQFYKAVVKFKPFNKDTTLPCAKRMDQYFAYAFSGLVEVKIPVVMKLVDGKRSYLFDLHHVGIRKFCGSHRSLIDSNWLTFVEMIMADLHLVHMANTFDLPNYGIPEEKAPELPTTDAPEMKQKKEPDVQAQPNAAEVAKAMMKQIRFGELFNNFCYTVQGSLEVLREEFTIFRDQIPVHLEDSMRDMTREAVKTIAQQMLTASNSSVAPVESTEGIVVAAVKPIAKSRRSANEKSARNVQQMEFLRKMKSCGLTEIVAGLYLLSKNGFRIKMPTQGGMNTRVSLVRFQDFEAQQLKLLINYVDASLGCEMYAIDSDEEEIDSNLAAAIVQSYALLITTGPKVGKFPISLNVINGGSLIGTHTLVVKVKKRHGSYKHEEPLRALCSKKPNNGRKRRANFQEPEEDVDDGNDSVDEGILTCVGCEGEAAFRQDNFDEGIDDCMECPLHPTSKAVPLFEQAEGSGNADGKAENVDSSSDSDISLLLDAAAPADANPKEVVQVPACFLLTNDADDATEVPVMKKKSGTAKNGKEESADENGKKVAAGTKNGVSDDSPLMIPEALLNVTGRMLNRHVASASFDTEEASTSSTALKRDQQRYARNATTVSMRMLAELGFNDAYSNMALLKKYSNDLTKVIQELLNMKLGEKPVGARFDQLD